MMFFAEVLAGPWGHGGALQRDDKGETYYFDFGKDYVMYDPTIEQLYSQIYISP